MANQHNGRPAGLGTPGQVGGTLAHLRHRAGCRGELVRIHGLNGVDHGYVGLQRIDGGEYLVELNLGQHLDLAGIQTQPARTQRHLGTTLLSCDVERRLPAALQRIERLQQKRGLANARVAANQNHGTFDDTAAQHTIELILTGGGALDIGGFNVGQHRDFGCLCQRLKLGCVAVPAGCGRFSHGLDQCVPGRATRAFTEPLGTGATALGAGVDGFFFCHAPIILYEITAF